MAIELDILFAGLFPHHEDKLLEFPQSLHPFCGRGIGIWQYFFDPEKLRFFLHDIRAVKLLQTYEINIDE